MADVEEDVVVEGEDVSEVTTDDVGDNPYIKDSYEYEEVVALAEKLKKAEDSRKKAESALVEKKRAEKEAKKQKEASPSASGEFITKQELELERFLDKNPDMEEYRDDLVKYTSKGISLKEAKILVENEPSIQNRKKINQMNISATDGAVRSVTYTKEALAKMSQSEYNKARDMLDSGKATMR